MEPKNYKALFNLGNSYYKQKKFSDAIREYKSLAENNSDQSVQANAYYNLGNSIFKIAQDSSVNPLFQFEKYQESIDNYQKSMIKNPNDLPAKMNFLFVSNLLK